MGELARRKLGIEEFLAWAAGQERKHELVGGDAVMMAGASRQHDRIVVNALGELRNQLRGRPCQPFCSDTFVRIPAGNARLPDLGVDCGPFDRRSVAATDPRLVVEVLSPNTRRYDSHAKLDEYKTVEGLEYILLVDPDEPRVSLYWRDQSRNWMNDQISGMDAAVELPSLGVQLRLADLYETLTFRARPTAVVPELEPEAEPDNEDSPGSAP
jgi:Uma2 family endonuclease